MSEYTQTQSCQIHSSYSAKITNINTQWHFLETPTIVGLAAVINPKVLIAKTVWLVRIAKDFFTGNVHLKAKTLIYNI